MILTESPKKALRDFCIDVEEKLGVEKKIVYKYALQSLIYYGASKMDRSLYRDGQLLENRWYKSLKSGKPDYSVYSEPSYLGDVWACWQIYSRNYLRNITKENSLFDKSIVEDISVKGIKYIFDLGCGFGYTTVGLKQIFKNCDVYGTNLQNTVQYKYCKTLESRFGIKIIPDVNAVDQKADLIFASEYFEHFYEPIKHLDYILEVTEPRHLLLANAFGAKSLGHFDYYKVGDKLVSNKDISKIFNNHLKTNGFVKVKTKLWNNRPNYWKYKDEL